MSKHIQKLIEQGENQQLDFKFEISDSRKIARTLVAFANTEGGTLLIGVKDNGIIAGIRSDEEAHMVQAAIQMYCKPKIKYEVKEWEIEGKTILEVKILPGKSAIYYAQNQNGRWLAYLRKMDQNLLAPRVILNVWKKQSRRQGIKINYGETEHILLNYLKNHPSITLGQFCRLAKISRHRAESILVDFIVLEIIDVIFTERAISYQLSESNKKIG